jgi:hypothetical protein
VQIEQDQNRYPYPDTPVAYRQVRHAVSHAAAFHANLALTRWTRGGDIPHVYASIRNVPTRAVWYAQAQSHFASWLENGGFRALDHEGK